jgi:hypothetical protein
MRSVGVLFIISIESRTIFNSRVFRRGLNASEDLNVLSTYENGSGRFKGEAAYR